MIHRAEKRERKREERRKKDDRDIPVAAASANRDTIAIGTRDTRRNASVPSLGSKVSLKREEETVKRRTDREIERERDRGRRDTSRLGGRDKG